MFPALRPATSPVKTSFKGEISRMDDEQIFRLQLAYNRARKRYAEADTKLQNMSLKFERLANSLGRQKYGSSSRRLPVRLNARGEGFVPTEAEVVDLAESLNVAAIEMLRSWDEVPKDSKGECNPLPHSIQAYDWEKLLSERAATD